MIIFLHTYKNRIAGVLDYPKYALKWSFFNPGDFFDKLNQALVFSKDVITWLEMVLEHDAPLIDHPIVIQRPHAGQNRYKLPYINQLREFLGVFQGNRMKQPVDFA